RLADAACRSRRGPTPHGRAERAGRVSPLASEPLALRPWSEGPPPPAQITGGDVRRGSRDAGDVPGRAARALRGEPGRGDPRRGRDAAAGSQRGRRGAPSLRLRLAAGE